MDSFLIKKTKTDAVVAATPVEGETENEIKTEAKRKFKEEWLLKFNWLKETNGNAYCTACERKITNNLSHLNRHAANDLHKQNLQTKKNQLSISSFFNDNHIRIQESVRFAELTLVMFVITHNLPFRLMDYLPDLLLVCCPDSEIAKRLKCARTKASNIAEILADKAKQNIVSSIKDKKYSLIVDETTDLSNKKCLVIVVRYFDSSLYAIKDSFLALIELVRCDAENIYKSIKEFLLNNGIPLCNLIGLATDGASTMAGNLNGLKAKFERETKLFFMKCTCHSLHLCSSHACKTLPCNVERLCRDIYKFFAYSPKRTNELKEFQAYCEVKPHKILGISLTRWLALENVISRINEQWDALQLYFLSCSLEVNGIKSIELANLMLDPEIKLYMLFLPYILKIINILNKEFQSENVRLPFLYERIETFFKLILCNYMKSNFVRFVNTLKDFNVCNEIGYLPVDEIFIGFKADSFLKSDKFTDAQRLTIKLNIRKFYIELLKQIQKRFDFGREDIKNLSIISPSKVLCNDDVTIQPLLNEFSYLVPGDPDTILIQWRQLRLAKLDFESCTDISEFWKKASAINNGLGESCFKELVEFVNALMSLPHSSAAAERKFFDLSLVKTKLRNKLEMKMLNNIMLAKELNKYQIQAHSVWSAKDHF